jgi:hypothetical protein
MFHSYVSLPEGTRKVRRTRIPQCGCILAGMTCCCDAPGQIAANHRYIYINDTFRLVQLDLSGFKNGGLD